VPIILTLLEFLLSTLPFFLLFPFLICLKIKFLKEDHSPFVL
jgi:type IV secretory pathway TrbL component